MIVTIKVVPDIEKDLEDADRVQSGPEGHAMMTATTSPLAKELETYYAHQQELLQTAAGKYVVIKGTNILGIYDSATEAYGQTYQRLGNVPFLLRRVQEQEQVYVIGGSLM